MTTTRDRTRCSDELRDVLTGLRADPPRLAPRWFYDDLGSALYEAITRLPEYYPTRAELELLRVHGAEIAARLPRGARLVELGSGSAEKASLLLAPMAAPESYRPVDVSAAALAETVRAARARFPALDVRPHRASFADARAFGALLDELAGDAPLVLYFSGSTLGNFERAAAAAWMRELAQHVPAGTRFLLGLDLVKAERRLVDAYDDGTGVTAAFNRNALAHLNRRFGADFAPARWRHEAVWNAERQRIEMWLRTDAPQVVHVGDERLVFDAGDGIHTESSHKWTRAAVERLIEGSPWRLDGWWTDPRGDFAEALLVR
ncbi:MAG: L-histidine N(alpha)-methyltransferase [Planctomycetes bacterium]|nr:L-histidine N(alpha)-methyltransferase [Planctomycetota bacterium]